MIAPLEQFGRYSDNRIASEMLEQPQAAAKQSGVSDSESLLIDTVGRHPVLAITAATAIGAVAGWLIKRKLFQ